MSKPIRVLVVGCGNMGTSHAKAYRASPIFEIAGLVSRGEKSRKALSKALGGYPQYGSLEEALAGTKVDAVCVSTYPDTHAEYAGAALRAGCHVFLEKPIAVTHEDAQWLVDLSRSQNRKLVVGYILQHHPAWARFVEEAQRLGKPLVMRMNLNQQSAGKEWLTHKNILSSMSPIVDCGVHYVDVMCRMTKARPLHVHAIGARLSEEIAPEMMNYGQLQVKFEDGSVGWYEAGWGPMISQTAFFVKDVIGPLGSASIAASSSTLQDSADVNSHTKTDSLLVHSAALGADGSFARKDEVIAMTDEPDHDGLCAREQDFFAKAILEDLDLTEHLDAALRSLQIVLAADESIRRGEVVHLT
jgi:predicted dehydrogenase